MNTIGIATPNPLGSTVLATVKEIIQILLKVLFH